MLYKAMGCIVPNTFTYPNKNNPHLAEFIGIVLGDGGITESQVQITLNSIADKMYVHYVKNLIKKLFFYTPSIYKRRDSQATIIIITGINFVFHMKQLGLKIGNKTKQQVAVPSWIINNHTLSNWCVRGLMDTDGGIFTHSYKVNGKKYSYLKLQFSNRSRPL